MSASSPGEIADYFGASNVGETLTEANYNVAPSVNVPVITAVPEATADADADNAALRSLDLMRWGLIPFWAKSASIGNKMINARVETVVEKSAFRNAVKKHRCIIPADAFYEWTSVPDPNAKKPRKQPWCIRRNDGAPFAFAGLFESWKDPEGDGTRLRSCTILTGPANEAMQPIHDRMPIMIAPHQWDAWLNPADLDPEQLLAALEAPPVELFEIYAVSTAVNNSRSSGAQLVEEVEPMTAESLAAEAAAEPSQESLL